MEQNDGTQGLPYCCHLDTEKYFRTFIYLPEHIVVGRFLKLIVARLDLNSNGFPLS